MKCLVVLCLLVPIDIATATEVASLDLFPNFNTVGVNAKLATPDAEKDAWAMLEYGLTANELTRGFPLSRVDNNFQRLSGAIFWCQPNTKYNVRITLRDKTTPAIDGTVLTGNTMTRLEPSFPRLSKTLFVSPQGKGVACTRTRPGTLTAALAQVKEGQRILLLKGRYYVGNLKLAASGTACSQYSSRATREKPSCSTAPNHNRSSGKRLMTRGST